MYYSSILVFHSSGPGLVICFCFCFLFGFWSPLCSRFGRIYRPFFGQATYIILLTAYRTLFSCSLLLRSCRYILGSINEYIRIGLHSYTGPNTMLISSSMSQRSHPEPHRSDYHKNAPFALAHSPHREEWPVYRTHPHRARLQARTRILVQFLLG